VGRQGLSGVLLAQPADPVAPWALVVALVSLVVTAGVGVYSAHSQRKTTRENAELAAWPALVRSLQDELTRSHDAHQANQAALADLVGRVVLLERVVQSLTAPGLRPDRGTE